jgi:hypothetical protein
MSPASFEVASTVRCIHDEKKCGLGKACGYNGVAGKLGTVLDTAPLHRPVVDYKCQRTSHSPSVRVAFIGRDRPAVVPVDQIELATDISTDEMIGAWQGDMDRVSAHTERTMKYYDEAPDGSKQKRDAQATFDYLSHRRMLIESAFNTLIP